MYPICVECWLQAFYTNRVHKSWSKDSWNNESSNLPNECRMLWVNIWSKDSWNNDSSKLRSGIFYSLKAQGLKNSWFNIALFYHYTLNEYNLCKMLAHFLTLNNVSNLFKMLAHFWTFKNVFNLCKMLAHNFGYFPILDRLILSYLILMKSSSM